LFPGVLLVEALAQLAGIIAQSRAAGQSRRRLRLTALRAVKILGTARPTETIRFEARLLTRMGPLIQAEGTGMIADRVILRAELTLAEEPAKGD
jgi:3-hydroxymyristoyl/3-hydroxydecanoyl-(acyl carrier protein) dehydratase